MNVALRVAKNSIALLSGQIYGVVINLLAISLIARHLPLDTFGEYGFILAVCVTLSMIGDTGINRIAIREMARERETEGKNKILMATIINKAFLSILSFAAMMFVVWIFFGSARIILVTTLCALATIIKIIGDIPEAVFKAHEQMKYNAYLKIVEDTSYIIGILVVVSLDYGLYGIFMALLLSAVIRIISGVWILSRNFFLPRLEWDLHLAIWLFKEAFPIGINRIFRKAGLRIDTVILALLRTKQEVGIFHGIYRIILIASVIPFNITETLFPIFSRYARDSHDSLRMAFEKSFKFLVILVLPLILTIFLWAEYIIHFFLGEKFSMAVPLMQVLVLLLGFRFFTILCTKILNASNQQRHATYASGIALGVNVVLDFILIYFFGYMGAALATLIGDITLFVVSMVYVKKFVCTFELRPIIGKPLLFFFMAGIAAFALKGVHFPLAILLAISIYTVPLFIFKVFEKSELNLVIEALELVKIKARKRFLSV